MIEYPLGIFSNLSNKFFQFLIKKTYLKNQKVSINPTLPKPILNFQLILFLKP